VLEASSEAEELRSLEAQKLRGLGAQKLSSLEAFLPRNPFCLCYYTGLEAFRRKYSCAAAQAEGYEASLIFAVKIEAYGDMAV